MKPVAFSRFCSNSQRSPRAFIAAAAPRRSSGLCRFLFAATTGALLLGGPSVAQAQSPVAPSANLDVPGEVPGGASGGAAANASASSTSVLRLPGAVRGLQRGPYRLGPLDVISVVVERHPEFSDSNVVVPPDGRIFLPAAGSLSVAGKTVAQVRAEVRRRLLARLRSPRVTVNIRSFRPVPAAGYVNVIGDAVRPRIVEILPSWRITEVLSAIGGATAPTEEIRATLARPGTRLIAVDLRAAVSRPLSRANLRLRPNDVLTLSRIAPVTVIGDVERAGAYGWRTASTLQDAVLAAGGLRQNARVSRGYLVRNGRRVAVDLEAALEQKDAGANIALRPGDYLTVEAVPRLNVSVTGEFASQQSYLQLEPGARVLQAILRAGGLRERPEKVQATLRRGDQVLPIDLERLLIAQDISADIPLRDNDVVSLGEPEVIRVQVTGRVNRPGPLRLAPGSTLQDALTQAQGLNLTSQAARITVLRRTREGGERGGERGGEVVLRIDAEGLIDRRDLSQNPRLQDGDVISVTEAQVSTVTVTGEVRQAGAIPLRPGEGLPELLARVGTTPLAALTRVVVRRGEVRHQVDVYRALRQGVGRPDFALQDGDFVVVPRNTARVLVMNAVAAPGYYPIPENETLSVLDALAAAGGTRPGARTDAVAVVRARPGGQTQTTTVRLGKIARGEIGAANFTLQSGDIVFVPEARQKTSLLDQVGRAIGVLGLFRSLPF